MRRGRELGRVLRPAERRADQQDADQQQPAVHVQLAGLPGGPAAGDLAAERRLPADRDRRQPQGRHPAEPDAQHQPGELVLREVVRPGVA